MLKEEELSSFFDSVKSTLLTESDVIVVITHFTLIKAGFHCQNTQDLALPQNWNASRTSWYLKYALEDKKFDLVADNSDGSIRLTLMDMDRMEFLSQFVINLDTVKSMDGSLEASVPDYKLLIEEINGKLISPVFSKFRKGTSNACNLTSVVLGVGGFFLFGIISGHIGPKTK